MSFDLLVFDLDGTLADSAPDIAGALTCVLARMGRREVSSQEVVAALGGGVHQLIERTAQPPHEPVVEAFLREYGDHLLDQTRLFPGVAETLSSLPGPKIVLSNKPEALSRRLVEGLGIGAHFRAVYGGDSFPSRKPDPVCFRCAIGGARRPLMVGDSSIDVATARNAGVPICGVSYGYMKLGDLQDADYRIDRFAQLLDIVR